MTNNTTYEILKLWRKCFKNILKHFKTFSSSSEYQQCQQIFPDGYQGKILLSSCNFLFVDQKQTLLRGQTLAYK